jgi:hypothetical protein
MSQQVNLEVGNVVFTHTGVFHCVSDFDSDFYRDFLEMYPDHSKGGRTNFLVLEWVKNSEKDRVKLLSLDYRTVWWVSSWTFLNWFVDYRPPDP